MTLLQREALQMCLEYIETDAHERRHVRWKINEALAEQPAQQEPVAWKHDCAALLANDVELWIDRCPHCGKPRTSPQPAQQQEPVANGKLKVTLQDTPTEIELAQYKRMFSAACAALGEINEALGLDPDDGGAEPILSAIAELKSCATCEALARIVMLDQTSHDTSPPAQRKPLTDEELANILPDDDTPMSLGEAFVKFARAIEAKHNIKENT